MNTPAAIRVLHALTATPQPLETIATRTGLTLQQAHSELGLLSADGRANSTLAGWFLA